ncbi:hypothetical protein Tco_0647518 [Tanacetum coccineum]
MNQTQGNSKEVGTPRYLSLVVPLRKVGDEAVHKELGDRMERAATTASSSEAEQDSGSGPRCQYTILGDVDAQTSKAVVVTEASIRSSLLLNDADGTACLTNEAIFQNLALMGYEGELNKLMFLNNQIELGEPFNDVYITPAHTLKVFSNMSRKGLKFLGRITPLFPNMLASAEVEEGKGSEQPTEPQPTPSPTQPSVGDQPHVPESSSGPDNTHSPSMNLEGTGGNQGGQVQLSNDSPHSGGNTSKRAEGGLNLEELLSLCTNLSNRVLALETSKDAQVAKILKLKIRIKKLEKKCMPRPTLDAFEALDDDLVHGMDYMETEEAVNKGGSNEEPVNAAGNIGVSIAVNISTATPMTPPTTTKVFEDEDIFLADALVMLSDKAKLKGVEIKEMKDAERPARLVLTLKPLPKIDPKDKGKGVLEEEPKPVRTTGLQRFKKLDAEATLVNEQQNEDLMFDNGVLHDDEVFVDVFPISTADIGEVTAAKIDELTLAKTLIEIKEAKPKVVTTAATTTTTARPKAKGVVVQEPKNTQAMMEADRLLAERLQSKEREELTDKEKGKLFMELMEKRRKHFATLRAQEKRNRPPTKAQKRTQMSTYLKHMGGYTYKQLKGKNFNEIQKLCDKEMKRVNTFMAMGSEEQESKEKKTEGSEEIGKGSRKKMLGRKKAGKQQQQESSKKQKIEEDKESDEAEEVSEDDEGELLKHLVIKKDEEIAIDAIPLTTKLPVIVDYKLHKEGPSTSLIDLPLDGYAYTWAYKTTNKMNFFTLGFNFDGFDKMVEDTWKRLATVDSNGKINLQKKLQALKIVIKQWTKNAKKSSYMAKISIQSKLLDIEKILDQGGKGDENTKFFHGILNTKCFQLAIHRTLVDGEWIVGLLVVKSVFLKYFSIQFSSLVSPRIYFADQFTNRLSLEQQDDLE